MPAVFQGDLYTASTTCVGTHLARLEMEILLAALVERVRRIKAGRPPPAWTTSCRASPACRRD